MIIIKSNKKHNEKIEVGKDSIRIPIQNKSERSKTSFQLKEKIKNNLKLFFLYFLFLLLTIVGVGWIFDYIVCN